MLEDKFTRSIERKLGNVTKEYKKQYAEISSLIGYNNNQREYQDNYRKIMEYKGEQVSNNNKDINNTESNINVENRKVFYDSQKSDFYSKLNNVLFVIYYVVVLVLAGIVLGVQKKYTNRNAIITIVLLLIYPLVIKKIYSWGVKLYRGIKHVLTYV
ncbi:MAG: hypothetical protein NT02SARS_1596 [SAR86 cluster bacterium SAR86B]|uniref:Uncharacterized protein n=1 Tax=SAR86 cluster bacterium SAR86B TaxID=1123867 RepID=J5KLT3_9GAMM|nr:MAG: hypothetical protein NT02SARS_1596 [SAR86 cluster bacterium SAR86B]